MFSCEFCWISKNIWSYMSVKEQALEKTRFQCFITILLIFQKFTIKFITPRKSMHIFRRFYINNLFPTMGIHFDKIIVILLRFVWYEITSFLIKDILYISQLDSRQNNDIWLQTQLRETLLQGTFVNNWQKRQKYTHRRTRAPKMKQHTTYQTMIKQH